MSGERLKFFLEEHHVAFEKIPHSLAYTAQEVAARSHVSGKELAKTVIIKVNGRVAMVVTPGHLKIDLKALKDALHADDILLASEYEFQEYFPECEVGAMPPFGNLYDMEVYVTEELTKDEKIAFNAGNHSELIQISYKDFDKLVHPKVVNLHH
jgi:Ala-tRNA(Pro) deacylase